MKCIETLKQSTVGFIVAVAALFLLAESGVAGTVKISATLKPTVITMGEKATLEVQVVADRGAKGRFPIFDGVSPDGFATMAGDTIELGAGFRGSSIDLGSGRMQTDYKIPVQAFDSGFYSLPPLAYVSGGDTVYTGPLSLKVVPVAASADDEMSDYTSTRAPGEGSFFDSIPLWLLRWWWALLLVVIAAMALLLFFMRYKRVAIRRKKRLLPPYEEAVSSLAALNARKLWQNGMEKQYYTELVDILRRYISRRFDMPAMEMTTGQILEGVRRHERMMPYLRQFTAVLAIADFAKFANMKCTPAENEGAFDEVRKFVEATRPTQEERKAEAEKERREIPRPKGPRWERRRKPARPSSAVADTPAGSGDGKEVEK